MSARAEARWILQAAGHSGTSEPKSSEVERALTLVARRARGEPLQYVTGIAGFRRLELAVGPGVFIPRPETELVAELAMAMLPQGGIVVDVGTGSGAIALSIAQERPDARVLATEKSPEALAWARKNRDELGSPVDLLEGDMFDALPPLLQGAVDVAVSNPPYVPSGDRDTLPRDVTEHEPHMALFADVTGVALIQRICIDAIAWLKPGGWLVLEIGHGQGARVSALMTAAGYRDVEVRDDLAERERIASGRR